MSSTLASYAMKSAKVVTLPGLFTLKRGICTTTCKPSMIAQTLLRGPDISTLITKLEAVAVDVDSEAVEPYCSTYFASSSDAICVGMGEYLSKLS